MNRNPLFTAAQIVRLSFAGACLLLGMIIMGTVPTAGTHPAIVTGDGVGQEFWGLVFLAAAGICAGISLYRFARPRNRRLRVIDTGKFIVKPATQQDFSQAS